MCDPISPAVLTALAIGSGLTAAGGAAYSTVSARNAAATEAASQGQMIQNQNNAFMARNRAQQDLTASTGDIQDQGLDAQRSAADQMRRQQDAATAAKDQQLQEVNAQAAKNDQQGQTLGQTLSDATSGPALAAAQEADAAARSGAVAPTVSNIQVSNPLSSSASSGSDGTNQGDSTVQQATLKRMAEAAGSVRDYASRAATIGSYGAPTFAVGQAVQNNQTGLLPAQLSDQLLKSGEGVKLLPYSTAYGNATNLGGTAQQDILSSTAGRQNLANLTFGNAVDESNLSQADKDQLAQNRSNAAAADAKIQGSLGQLISTAGNIGLMGAGYYGAKPGTPGVSLTPAQAESQLGLPARTN